MMCSKVGRLSASEDQQEMTRSRSVCANSKGGKVTKGGGACREMGLSQAVAVGACEEPEVCIGPLSTCKGRTLWFKGRQRSHTPKGLSVNQGVMKVQDLTLCLLAERSVF